MKRPQFLVIGHTVQDLTSEDNSTIGKTAWRLGGAAAFAAVTARNLGMRTAVLTSASPDLQIEEMLPDIDVKVVPSRRTTQIRNVYSEGPRRQYVPQRASPLSVEHLPSEWNQTPIVLLGPVMGELEEEFAVLSSFALGNRGAGLAATGGPGQPRAADHAC